METNAPRSITEVKQEQLDALTNAPTPASESPRTDEAEYTTMHGDDSAKVLASFARDLERSLATATAELTEARKRVAELEATLAELRKPTTKPTTGQSRPSFFEYEVLPPDGTKAP